MINVFLRNFLRERRGVSAIEFAFLAPIFLILLMGGFEAGRYIMIINKLQSASYAMVGIVSQTRPATTMNACDDLRLNSETITNILSGMPNLMRPFANNNNPTQVIVTSLVRSQDGSMRIMWRHSQGQVQGAASEVGGAPGGPATFTDPFVVTQMANLTPNENMVLLEGFFRYQPVFPRIFGAVSDTFTARTLSKRIYFYNRLGKAIYLPPNFPVVGEIPCGNGPGGGA